MNFALRDWLGNGKGRKRVLLSEAEDEKELDGDGGGGEEGGGGEANREERSENVAKVICTELSFFSAFCSNRLSNGSAG